MAGSGRTTRYRVPTSAFFLTRDHGGRRAARLEETSCQGQCTHSRFFLFLFLLSSPFFFVFSALLSCSISVTLQASSQIPLPSFSVRVAEDRRTLRFFFFFFFSFCTCMPTWCSEGRPVQMNALAVCYAFPQWYTIYVNTYFRGYEGTSSGRISFLLVSNCHQDSCRYLNTSLLCFLDAFLFSSDPQDPTRTIPPGVYTSWSPAWTYVAREWFRCFPSSSFLLLFFFFCFLRW